MSRRAFTLVELLTVISIIALLAGLVLPSFQGALEAGRRTRCVTNLHAVGLGMKMYLHDSDDVMPVAAQMPSLGLNDYPRIVDVLAECLSDPEVLRCPSDPQAKYFRAEGSSYEYNSMLGGRRLSDSHFVRRFGEHKVPMMYDYEPFHGKAGKVGATNCLYADGHVDDLLSRD